MDERFARFIRKNPDETAVFQSKSSIIHYLLTNHFNQLKNMKKLIIMAVLCLLASASHVSATSFFSLRTETTTPVNDTLRISPNYVGTYCPLHATVNLEGYIDHWNVQFTYPDSMNIIELEPGPDMTLSYTRIDGTDTVYKVPLTTHYKDISNGNGSRSSYFSATSTVFGCWDPDGDGYYEQYGTVKWATGFYNDMISFKLKIPNRSTVGTIDITGYFSCSTDWRLVPTINGPFSKTLYFKVAFLRGDANGDDAVNISDVTTITDWLIDGLDGVNPYKITAADMDGDGEITINDATLLFDYLLLNGSNEYDDEPLI